ncbi:hypothetical protein AGMMS49938_02970 [Fibrobacterales bacterium]|nr:hypothetical protein AGMMS49938_02970 [Fibrobacterales bacterium]
MLAHEFFHEQAHLEKQHELKRRFFLLGIVTTALITVFTIYKFFCYRQEYEADCIAAKKCGKENAVKSLKMLGNLRHSFLSLHPPTKKRIEKIYGKSGTKNKKAHKSTLAFF